MLVTGTPTAATGYCSSAELAAPVPVPSAASRIGRVPPGIGAPGHHGADQILLASTRARSAGRASGTRAALVGSRSGQGVREEKTGERQSGRQGLSNGSHPAGNVPLAESKELVR